MSLPTMQVNRGRQWVLREQPALRPVSSDGDVLVKTSPQICPLYQSAQAQDDVVAIILPTSGICKDVGSVTAEPHAMWSASSCLRNPRQAGTLLVTVAEGTPTMGCPLSAVIPSGPEATCLPPLCSQLSEQGVPCDLANTGSGSCKGHMYHRVRVGTVGQCLALDTCVFIAQVIVSVSSAGVSFAEVSVPPRAWQGKHTAGPREAITE